MPSSKPSHPDQVDDLLTVSPAPERATSLRQSLLAETTGVIRRRRRLKRSALAVLLACCYLAGLATDRFLFSAAGPDLAQDESPKKSDGAWEWPAPPENELRGFARKRSAKKRTDKPRRPRVSRSRFARMRAVADRHLNESGNIELATRIYARSLNHATPEELAIAADDSWLLMALKSERTAQLKNEERRNEHREG